MNIPEIYLIEPYNAYAPKQKKKHWMQEVEEQQLLARIIAEQQQLREATNKNATLAPLAPSQATPTVGGIPQGGAGGAPRPQFYNPESGSSVYTFTIIQSGITASLASTGSAPTTLQFAINGGANTINLNGATANWIWGDGTTLSGSINPSHTYTGTGSFGVTMSVVSTMNPSNVLSYQALPVTMSVPTVASAFTVTGATVALNNGFYTASVGDILTFVNGASSNNPRNPLTYNWTFGSGSAPSSSLKNPTYTYSSASAGAGYTVILGVSGSFNAITTGTRNIKIV